MATHVPSNEELFSDVTDPVARVERFEAFKTALNKSAEERAARDRAGQYFVPGQGWQAGAPRPGAELDAAVATLEKSVSADVLAGLQGEIDRAKAAQADLAKDITLTSPLSTGLVPFDLQAPAKFLAPRNTPLRNKIARTQGVGTAARFKRITGISGSQTGGVANMRASVNSSTTTAFGSVSYQRGPKIGYAADEKTVNLKQFSLSDAVTWSAQFAGRGFEDIRQLSQTALLYASMLADERHMLGGRGTDAGYVGAVAAPAGVTLTARAAAAGETGLTAAGRYWVKVTARSMFGESVLSAAFNVDSVSAGQVIDVVVGTEPAGAVGYNVYVAQVAAAGADPGDAARWLQGAGTYSGSTGYSKFTLQGTMLTSGTAASSITADGTATADEYDGLLSVLQDSTQSGYVKRLNAAFSTSNPGVEYQNAFASLFDAVKADPDEVILNGFDRKQLSDSMKAGSTTPGYRFTVNQNEVGGVVMGTLVSTIVNEVTGKELQLTVHPWMPQGNSIVWSHTVPLPDSEVGQTTEFRYVQDYVAMNWPVTQFQYEVSSYWYGALVHYAPAWSGYVGGIAKV